MRSNNQKNMSKKIPEIVSKKINLDNDKLAAERIVEIWESLSNDNISKPTNWIKFKWFLKVMKLRDIVRRGLKKISPRRLRLNKDYKFPALEINDITERISKLQNLLGIDKKLECKYCNKNYSTKSNLNKHHKCCKDKKDNEEAKESMNELVKIFFQYLLLLQ